MLHDTVGDLSSHTKWKTNINSSLLEYEIIKHLTSFFKSSFIKTFNSKREKYNTNYVIFKRVQL